MKLTIPDQTEARAEHDAFFARSVVYFITPRRHSDGPIKIGRSTRGSLLRRFSAIQVSMAEQMNALFVLEASAEDEADLHNRYADFRTSGEWFTRNDDLMELLEEMTSLARWWRDDFGVNQRWSVPPIVTRRQLDKMPPRERPKFYRLAE